MLLEYAYFYLFSTMASVSIHTLSFYTKIDLDEIMKAGRSYKHIHVLRNSDCANTFTITKKKKRKKVLCLLL